MSLKRDTLELGEMQTADNFRGSSMSYGNNLSIWNSFFSYIPLLEYALALEKFISYTAEYLHVYIKIIIFWSPCHIKHQHLELKC